MWGSDQERPEGDARTGRDQEPAPVRTVAIVTTWGEATSLGRVTRDIVSRLPGDVRALVFALDLQPGAADAGVVPCYVANDETRNAAYLGFLLDALRPDVVIYYFDLFMAGHHVPYLTRLRPFGTRLVAYLPVDGRIEALTLLGPFLHFDEVVFFTRAHASQFDEAVQRAGIQRAPARWIPHGADPTRFHPSDDSPSEGARLASLEALQGSFLVLNGNRPLPRKRLDLTLEGFALFVADTGADDAFLVLPLVEPDAELCALAAALGVRDRLVVGISHPRRLSVAELNRLYQLCPVGVNTAMGEAWGLVSWEHAAAGGAQIVPGSSHLMEIWGDAALYAEPASSGELFGLPGIGLDIVAPASVAAGLTRLYRAPALRRALSQRAQARVAEPGLQWPAIAESWARLLRQV